MKFPALLSAAVLLAGCQTLSPVAQDTSTPWRIVYAADENGLVKTGSIDDLFSVIRQGCNIKIAWGGRRADDPSRSIEHVANPIWINARNGNHVEAMIGGHAWNLAFLGTPSPEDDRVLSFGGRDQVVRWQAEATTGGAFDAVWFNSVTGVLTARRPQRFAMRWIADCAPDSTTPPLFDLLDE